MASRDHVDIDAVPHRAFGLSDDREPFHAAPHRHDRHQLLYAVHGSLRLIAETGTWLLPPQRAAWIRAGTVHEVVAARPTGLRTVYFAADFPSPAEPVCVFAVGELARELILLAMRWGPDAAQDACAAHAFGLLAHLGEEWAAAAAPWRMPRGRTPEVAAAIRFVRARFADPIGLADAASAAGTSARTLTRRLRDELGLTWRELLRTGRLLEAMERLADPEASVTTVALDVGFDSPSAFTVAFKAFVGETPSAFRAASRPSG